MQVYCPRCGAGTEVAAGAASARCAACGAGLPVHLPEYGPPSQHKPETFGVEHMAAVRAVPPPRNPLTWREAQTPDGAWLVSAGRNRTGCAFVLGLAFLGAMVLAASVLASDDKNPVPGAVVMMLVGVVFAYFALAAAVNRVTLRLDGQWLTVRRGPVPQPGNVRIDTASIQYFDLVKGAKFRSGGTTLVVYNVRVVAVASMRTLPLGMFPREQADGVVERLKHMLEDTRRRTGITAPVVPLVGPGAGGAFGGPMGGPPAF